MDLIKYVCQDKFVCIFGQADGKAGNLRALSMESTEAEVRAAVMEMVASEEISLLVKVDNVFEQARADSQEFMKRVTRILREVFPEIYAPYSQEEFEEGSFKSEGDGFLGNILPMVATESRVTRNMLFFGMGPFYPEDFRRYAPQAMFVISDKGRVERVANSAVGRRFTNSLTAGNTARYNSDHQSVWNRPFEKLTAEEQAGNIWKGQLWEED